LDDGSEDKLQIVLRQQSVLAKFGELALRSDDLDEILTQACRLVGEALGTDLAKVIKIKGNGESLLGRAGVGWKPGVVGVAAGEATDETSERAAFKSEVPIIFPGIDTELRVQYPSSLADDGIKAVASVVIIGHEDETPFGILQVDSRHPRQFDENDTAFLRSYANLIAAAVARLQANAALEAKSRDLAEANARLLIEAKERGRIEEALRQSQKMEAVGQLTGGLAHDFNNILTAISSSMELLRVRVLQGDMDALDRYIEAAIASTNRAAALTHRLLAFSRRQPLDPKVTDLNRLVRNMEEFFGRTAGPSIKVETKLANDLWLIMCDPNQFENALLNLVINARDAMPHGGCLTIETKNVIIPRNNNTAAATASLLPTDLPSGECVALLVTDDGAGMPPNVLERAFDPFFTTKPMGKGTGLGLSMIYGFARQSGGDVQLRSKERQGTTVVFHLPRHVGAIGADDEIEDVAIIHAEPPEVSHVVLVVEDEETILANIVEVFEYRGYTMLQADDGVSGLNVLETSPDVELLITDVGLPGTMNGCQLADAARRLRPDLKVLFITGYAESGLINNGPMDLSMQVMTKPFPVNALIAMAQELLNTTG
jgi:signal transduction histidine kinase/CheY-like chemotaxis protein